MDPLTLLTLATTAYGGYRGYRQSKDAGASGIGRLLGTAAGAYGGYQLGRTGGQMFFQQPQVPSSPSAGAGLFRGPAEYGITTRGKTPTPGSKNPFSGLGSLTNILKKGGQEGAEYSPARVSAALAALTYFGGAFDPQPTDVYQPTYNLAYGDFAKQRPGYSYIDPITGQEKEYAKVYIPEADPANRGDYRSGPYAIAKTRLKTGGLAEIKKFNEGGINYLPSKVSHDENDANNYVRASGYVEDGSGNGDKDEDTMLAQLADGEFVTRADGVLGAGIIAGANPNSMKDMREKGAQYFYEQQKRYKRVFDLLKDRNDSQEKKIN
jgi:hypothetical protein